MVLVPSLINMRVNIKPLSVNQVWQGRRFKTPIYKKYENELLFMLPKMKIPEGKLELTIVFGFSSSASDWDNPIKPFQDILQKRYSFNDSRVYKATIIKEIVKKGEEFIEFNIKEYGRK
jgi:Holliday junction resolvase RusA-like endonuclease